VVTTDKSFTIDTATPLTDGAGITVANGNIKATGTGKIVTISSTNIKFGTVTLPFGNPKIIVTAANVPITTGTNAAVPTDITAKNINIAGVLELTVEDGEITVDKGAITIVSGTVKTADTTGKFQYPGDDANMDLGLVAV